MVKNEDRQTEIENLLVELSKKDPSEVAKNTGDYIGHIIEIYTGDGEEKFRHMYAGIFNKIVEIDRNAVMNMEYLSLNLETIYKAFEAEVKKENVTLEIKDSFKSFYKLLDHVNLDISRIGYMKGIDDKTEETSAQTYESLAQIETEAKKATQKAEEIRKEFSDMQKTSITILGIFASIILTFFASMVFTKSVLENIANVNVFRLTFFIALIAMILFNAVFYLMQFILAINGKDTKDAGPSKVTIIIINIVLIAILALTPIIWKCCF